MMLKTHFLLGALFAPILYFIFHAGIVNSLIVLFASVLIDIDHYLFYAIGKNDWKPKNAFNFFLHLRKRFEALPKHERKKYHTGFFPLHSIEFLAISIFLLVLGVAGIFTSFLLFVLLGFSFHLVFDMIYEIFIAKRAINKISLIYTLSAKRFIGF